MGVLLIWLCYRRHRNKNSSSSQRIASSMPPRSNLPGQPNLSTAQTNSPSRNYFYRPHFRTYTAPTTAYGTLASNPKSPSPPETPNWTNVEYDPEQTFLALFPTQTSSIRSNTTRATANMHLGQSSSYTQPSPRFSSPRPSFSRGRIPSRLQNTNVRL